MNEFQFYCSAIKRDNRLIKQPCEKWFQFYCSAIKSDGDSVVYPISSSFNSTVVRLRAQGEGDINTVYVCFNSTVVRLRGGELIKTHDLYSGFQFYCSAIKRIHYCIGY